MSESACAPFMCRDRRASDSLELEIQVVVVQGTKLRTSGKVQVVLTTELSL